MIRGKNQVTGQGQDAEYSYYWANFTDGYNIDVASGLDTDDEINCCYGDLCTYDGGFSCTSCSGSYRVVFDEDVFVFETSFDGTSGTGCGTLAGRPATCTPGDGSGPGYWATDQSCSDLSGLVGAAHSSNIEGTLYRCSATDTWTEYFTPHTYPHPLRDESSSAANTGITITGGTLQ
jgi:hypothetical protein